MIDRLRQNESGN